LIFVADPETFKALCGDAALGGPARLRWDAQRTVCYDTNATALYRSGLSLQMRHARARNVMRLTTKEGAVEVTAPGEALQIALLPPPSQGLLARVTERKALRPWFSWQVRRATRLLTHEGAMIEVAFEEGEIVAEGRSAPIRNIGLKLKAGEPAALYRFGLSLANRRPLRLGVASLFERGLALALDSRASVRAQPPPFGADATLDAAIGVLLRQNLTHFLMNWPALESADADEAVHQIRVALRRLRSLLALLRRAFPAGEVDLLRAEAKRIADAFGEARDWRVFSDMVAEGPAQRLPGVAGLSALIALADARADAGRAAGASALEARTTARFVLALKIYISTSGWRNAASEAELRALGEPAVGFAAGALERSFRRLNKRARGFETLAPEARHEMRIALKQLRYAVDFFGPLFKPAADVDSFAGKASVLQDMLGAANDAAVASRLVASIDTAADPALAFAAGAVVGWGERGGALDEASLRGGWKALRKARRFWRDHLVSEAPETREAKAGG
jgi:inorganic triphosphatase YgiF